MRYGLNGRGLEDFGRLGMALGAIGRAAGNYSRGFLTIGWGRRITVPELRGEIARMVAAEREHLGAPGRGAAHELTAAWRTN
jgi:hypothetical protein